MTGIVVFISTVTLFTICMGLVLDRDYEDGLVGRVALSLIAIAAFSRASGIIDVWWQGETPVITNIGTMLWIGSALFFTRHAFRFVRWKRKGLHDWRTAHKPESGTRDRRATV